jgi:hypothetical protein
MEGIAMLALAGILLAAATALRAKGRAPRKYATTPERALTVTRELLGRHGYEVVRVTGQHLNRIIWYRRAGRRSDGQPPLRKIVIRRLPAERRVLLMHAPPAILGETDVHLRMS